MKHTINTKIMHVEKTCVKIIGIQVNLLLNMPYLVGAQLCRLSPVDARTVALKPVMAQ